MDRIPVLRRLTQEDGHKFKASLGFLISPALKEEER